MIKKKSKRSFAYHSAGGFAPQRQLHYLKLREVKRNVVELTIKKKKQKNYHKRIIIIKFIENPK
jgi:hypothetical protein